MANKISCPICLKGNANIHPVYGALACDTCNKRQSLFSLPTKPVEFSGEDIKKQRQEYAKSIIQPYRSGVLSKEYIEAFGTSKLKVSKKDIKNAKYCWRDLYSANTNIAKTK